MHESLHDFAVVVGGRELRDWEEVSIESDMLTPADSFSLTRAYDAITYDLLRNDAEVTLTIDGTPVLNGFIGRKFGNSAGFTITGKDRISRLVAESAPIAAKFDDKNLVQIAKTVVGPWFERIVLKSEHGKLVPRRVEPGSSRYEALAEFTDRLDLHVWSSGDGRSLVMGKPDYSQDVLHTFYETIDGSNCADIFYDDNNESRCALVVTVGTGHGDNVNYAANVLHRVGVARDNPETFNGVGKNFLHPKRVVMPVEATSVEECQRLAERELAERDASAFEVTVTAHGWGQVIPPATSPTLFAFDTIASIYAENTPVDGTYYIVSRRFERTRDTEQTVMRCVPLGAAI